MNAVRDWLYIGRYSETRNPSLLAAHHIGAMLQLIATLKYPEIESLYLPVEDGVPLTAHHLRQGIDFTLQQKQLGRRVLIACGAGMSRSASFTVAVLKEAEGLSLLEALQVVKSHHPDTLIHPELWKSLCLFYHEDVPLRRALDIMLVKK